MGRHSRSNGQPLRLELNYPSTSAVRKQMSLLAQQQLRQVGIDVVLRQFEFPVWYEHRNGRTLRHRLLFNHSGSVSLGITQGWSCGGGTNAAHYCNPRVDSLIRDAQSPAETTPAMRGTRRPTDRGRRTGRFPVRAKLRVRSQPAVRKRDDPAGVVVAAALEVDRGGAGARQNAGN